MASDEEFVRGNWKRVVYSESGLTHAGPCYVTIDDDDHPTAGSLLFMKHGESKEAVFFAAAEFTKERLKQIRQVEEEIALIRERQLYSEWDIWERVLDREQSALEALRRSMRAEKEDTDGRSIR